FHAQKYFMISRLVPLDTIFIKCYGMVMGLRADVIDKLPRATGVYILKNSHGQIIYIGKAKDIRNRLASYLGRDTRPYAGHIVSNTESVDFILTRNETEALLLENQLIKAHKPKFNIDLKDDKTYVRIKVTTGVDWPGIYITRKILKDGSHYFGPYSSAQATRKTLSAIGRIFPIRRCKDTVFKNRTRPCIYYQIGTCAAPCVGRISRNEYSALVQDLVSFLEGKNKNLEQGLHTRMNAESERLNYEAAARIRDQISAIKNTLIPQIVVSNAVADTDVFGTCNHPKGIRITVLHITKGIMTDSTNLTIDPGGDEDFISKAMLQFYLRTPSIPAMIYTDIIPEEKSELEQILTDMRGSTVTIRKAMRGRPKQWTGMARDNAEHYLSISDSSVLDDIARLLHLSVIPYRMECYDISNIQGAYSTASRAVFIAAEPDKSLYRHYRINDIHGQDDFAMMEQVLKRRLSTDEAKPDLIVIDGGKGQLNICMNVLDGLGMASIPVVAIAKARGTKTDRFFMPGRKTPILLSRHSRALRVLQRIRDEAHRFALRYHRHLRKRSGSSRMENIPGIGPKKARAILMHVSDIPDLAKITEEDLKGCPAINKHDIANIVSYFQKNQHVFS
ncbi:MAG: excinuclease ABC subunit UvrC, partial [Deltaproteobacteria bacterium]|nr:excinuclease ABC subunit UvrC [Deltaproteobacteria bacterium]